MLTGSLGLAGGLLIERMRSNRDAAARREARQALLDDLQRKTLLDLQDAIANFSRVVGRAHHHDEMEFKKSGTWGTSLLAADLDEEFLASQVRLTSTREGVRDDELRTRVNRFYNLGVLVTMARKREDAMTRLDQWMEALTELNDRLGTVLRTYL